MLLAKIKEALSSLYDDIQETPEAVETETATEEVATEPAVAEEAVPEFRAASGKQVRHTTAIRTRRIA